MMFTTRRFGLLVLVAVMLLVLGFASSGSVEASARDASWTVSVTYQNVGTGPATIVVNFYAENDATPIYFDPLNGGTLAPGAARSFWIGAVSSITPGFNGNAVISSDQPLTSNVVQFSQQPNFKMRMLYYGFQTGDASPQFLVPTVLWNKWDRTTVFSIQNTEDQPIVATVRFYDADNAGVLASTKSHDIPANSSKFIEMDNPADTGLTSGVFNGSAIITAVLQAGGDANVVAAANEYYTTINAATSFEGLPVSKASNSVSMATGLCEKWGSDTFYAVTNAELAGNATITATYYNTNGTQKAVDGPYTIGPGQKKSLFTCNPSDGTNMTDFTGSAVITSTGNPIVVMGKATVSTNAPTPGTADFYTAFLGESTGDSKQSFPFVRWANDADYSNLSNVGGRQRAYLAITNLENSPIKLNAKYYDKNGGLIATHVLTIPALSKANSDASVAGALGQSGMIAGSFGYYTDNTYGGGVIIEAHPDNPTAKFFGIARLQHPGAAEDVNSVPVP